MVEDLAKGKEKKQKGERNLSFAAEVCVVGGGEKKKKRGKPTRKKRPLLPERKKREKRKKGKNCVLNGLAKKKRQDCLHRYEGKG